MADEPRIIDARMHERMTVLGGLLGLMALVAIAIYFLGSFLVSAFLYILPKS